MKKINLNTLVGILFLLFSMSSCTDLDDNEIVDLTRETIKKDSELFGLLESVVNRGDDPIENTVCIDFIYPFKVFIYDANLVPQGEVILGGDDQFSAFLAQLPDNQSISISYPLETTLSDGTIFSVTNNAELKIAIDSCSREDIISYCSGLFGIPQGTCVWEIPYIEGINNDFAGAVFTADATGTITLYHHNATYDGTWIFLFLNDELHLNINLEGTSTTVQNWNYNFKIISFTGETMGLQTPTFSRTLVKKCSTLQMYSIGQTGPSGGIIAYDKGEFTNGWRYIEVAQDDLIIEEWGCLNGEIIDADYEQIGTGYQNSVAITNFHNDLTNYFTNPSVCSSLSNGTVSSKTAIQLVVNSKDNWFVPSMLELLLLYENLKSVGLGNFSDDLYWSSSEESIARAKCINFSNGEMSAPYKNSPLIKTRPIRYF